MRVKALEIHFLKLNYLIENNEKEIKSHIYEYESVSFVSSGCEKIPACECAFL